MDQTGVPTLDILLIITVYIIFYFYFFLYFYDNLNVYYDVCYKFNDYNSKLIMTRAQISMQSALFFWAIKDNAFQVHNIRFMYLTDTSKVKLLFCIFR